MKDKMMNNTQIAKLHNERVKQQEIAKNIEKARARKTVSIRTSIMEVCYE